MAIPPGPGDGDRRNYVRGGHLSVSYTHLDVYKRQVLGGVNVLLHESGLFGDLFPPVSYTHLDVYKRQL